MAVESINGYSDRQIAKAQRFVNADDRKVTRLAAKNYRKHYGEADKKFGKTMNVLTASLPAMAFVAGVANKRGVGSSLRVAAEWTAMLAAGKLAAEGMFALKKNNKTARKAEKKAPILTSLAEIGMVFGAAYGAMYGVRKVAKNPTVRSVVERGITDVSTKVGGLKLAQKAGELYSKTPEVLQQGISKVLSTNVSQRVLGAAKEVGMAALKSAPTLVVGAIVGSVVAKSVSIAKNFTDEKARIKNAQFETAKAMVNGLVDENKDLKTQLEVATSIM